MKKLKIPYKKIFSIIASLALLASIMVPAVYTVIDVLKNR